MQFAPLGPGLPGQCFSSTRRAGQCYAGNFTQGLGVLGLTMNTTDVNYFFQDDWRISPRFTLNLGVRYEYQRNPNPINANPSIPQTNRKVDDRDNIGPRVGFAWDLTGDGKTSLRGGWGLYYGRVINSTVYNALINTGVGADRGQRQVSFSATNPPPGGVGNLPIYPNLVTAGTPLPTAVQFFDDDFELPEIHQTDLIVEREIARNTVVSASYLFSYGKNLPNFVDTNLRPPSRFVNVAVVGGPFAGSTYLTPIFTGARPQPLFLQLTEIRSNVFSKYHALVLQANRRLTDGLQFQANYTLSRAFDNGQSSVTFSSNNLPFNAFDQQGENGLSNFDRRQKLVISAVYAPTPFTDGVGRMLFNGWTIAPILNAFSGQRNTGNISGSISPTAFGFASNTTQGGGVNGSGGGTRFGLLPRNAFKQPNIWYLDMRLSRRFNLGEDMKLEVLAEAFNMFNRTQVTGVNTTLYNFATAGCPAGNAQCLVFNPGFGAVTGADSTLFRERQVQLGIRFEF